MVDAVGHCRRLLFAATNAPPSASHACAIMTDEHCYATRRASAKAGPASAAPHASVPNTALQASRRSRQDAAGLIGSFCKRGAGPLSVAAPEFVPPKST